MKSLGAECNKDLHNMPEPCPHTGGFYRDPHANESSPHPDAPGELRGHFEAIRQLHKKIHRRFL